ncbi:hypothetical protein IAQ67_28635 (plasmid) [Paenibacillus peoriae]|uniref:HTH cro/C1-type domain-containing protein n=1 Tax=Paenibacillus peoriae TaxID=59893 RepID=A0A7H0YHC1_9BACL|nr:hypothetical protein [Paenibacillus peoriae]QNR70479.1 hypothetical protein IAQ67_28635 [Paenibacillus peoriae]
MAKTMLTYTTVNNLGERIQKMQRDHILRSRGETILIGKILEDIGKYCGVGSDAIDKVKMHINQPSLPLAMKIAEYFKCRPDEIFTLVPIRCSHCGAEWDGANRETTKRLICGSCKQVFEPTMN